jgi:arabinogalactan oligomer/maltooligosaccharide transport system substrate-binding protein
VSARIGIATVFTLIALWAGCERQPSHGAGWASEVPADAVRFVRQQAAQPGSRDPSAAVEGAEAPAARKYAEGITTPTEVVLWHSYRAAEHDALKQVVDAWAALGTQVTIQLRAVPFDAFNDKIRVVIPRGRGPDLFIFAHDTIGAWAEMDLIEPLSTWTTPEDRQLFLPDMVRALIYRNALYGLPLAFKSVALFYNKAIVPEPPKTFDELVATAKAFTKGDRYGLVYEAANLYFHAPWLHALGGGVLDANDNPILDSPAAVKALALARSLVREHKVTPMSVNTGMVSGYFNDGKAAMVINGPWMRGELQGVDYGVAPLPSVDGKPARPYLGVEAVYMSKQSTNKEAAIEVARFLVSDAAAKIRFEVGQQPVANQAVWAAAGDGLDPVMAGFLEQSKETVLMPSTPTMQQIWTPYNGALLSVIAGDTKPEAAMAEAQRDAERSISRARGAE